MPEEIIEQESNESETKRLFAAVYAPFSQEQNNIWSLQEGDYNVDKMQVSDKYEDQIALCRFFYRHDGLAYTTINKQVEIGINGYGLRPKECADSELLVYESLNQLMLDFLIRAASEYLTSGLVVPEVTWGSVKAQDISPDLKRSYKRIYELPVDLWHRNPLSLILHKTPLPNQVSTFVKISEDDIAFITNKGKYPDDTEDKEAYRILIREYPKFVRAVRKGKIAFKLEDPTLIRRYVKSGTVWPTPYLAPALELLIHKRNLRKMDYAIASRVISAIQLFRMGNDTFPLTEDDEDLVEEVKGQMRWRGLDRNIERVFQLFANHTLEIDWITPDVTALLDNSKYKSINDDILVALGLPRIVVAGESLRSGSSNAELALLPPASTIESMRRALLEFPRKLYKEIQTRNNFKGIPEPYYPPLRLQSLRELMEIGKNLYENAVISRTGWAELANFDFEAEMNRMVIEREKMKELDLPEFAPVPFTPQPHKVDQERQPEEE